MHVRRTTTEPSGCRDRSTACCVERRHWPEHIVATVPTDTREVATPDAGGSMPGMDICKAAELRLFFLAIVDLFYVRERVAQQRPCSHRFGACVVGGGALGLAWYPSLPRFLHPGPISGPERPEDLFLAFRSANRLSVTPVREFGRSVLICNRNCPVPAMISARTVPSGWTGDAVMESASGVAEVHHGQRMPWPVRLVPPGNDPVVATSRSYCGRKDCPPGRGRTPSKPSWSGRGSRGPLPASRLPQSGGSRRSARRHR